MITKGAVEEILSICSYISNIEINENSRIYEKDEKGNKKCDKEEIIDESNKEYKERKITNEDIEKIKIMTKELNEQGLRVVAICTKTINENISYTKENEKEMTLVRIYRIFRPTKRKCKK